MRKEAWRRRKNRPVREGDGHHAIGILTTPDVRFIKPVKTGVLIETSPLMGSGIGHQMPLLLVAAAALWLSGVVAFVPLTQRLTLSPGNFKEHGRPTPRGCPGPGIPLVPITIALKCHALDSPCPVYAQFLVPFAITSFAPLAAMLVRSQEASFDPRAWTRLRSLSPRTEGPSGWAASDPPRKPIPSSLFAAGAKSMPWAPVRAFWSILALYFGYMRSLWRPEVPRAPPRAPPSARPASLARFLLPAPRAAFRSAA